MNGEVVVCFGLDSTSVKAHPDGTGAWKTNGLQSIGKSSSRWYAKIHIVSASDRHEMIFRLSDGQARDAPEGRALLESWDNPVTNALLEMDRAYEGDKTRDLVEALGMPPVVPPEANRKSNGSTTRICTSCGTRSSGCSLLRAALTASTLKNEIPNPRRRFKRRFKQCDRCIHRMARDVILRQVDQCVGIGPIGRDQNMVQAVEQCRGSLCTDGRPSISRMSYGTPVTWPAGSNPVRIRSNR